MHSSEYFGKCYLKCCRMACVGFRFLIVSCTVLKLKKIYLFQLNKSKHKIKRKEKEKKAVRG